MSFQLEEEENKLLGAFKFAAELASNLSWRNMIHRFGLPGTAVLLLSRTEADRIEAMKMLRKIIDSLLHLKSKKKETGSKVLARLWDDLAWHEESLCRELMAMIKQSQYNHNDRDLQVLLSRLKTGTSTTKELLESTFAHLTDVSARGNKNKKMNAMSKWFYAVATPYGTVQAPQIMPCDADWLKYSTADEELRSYFAKLWSIADSTLPDIKYGEDERFPQSAQQIEKTKLRAAGPRSHMRSAAALLFMLVDYENSFQNAQHAELGQGQVLFGESGNPFSPLNSK